MPAIPVCGLRIASLAATIALATGIAGLTVFAQPSAASGDTAASPEQVTERHVPVTVVILEADVLTRPAENSSPSTAEDTATLPENATESHVPVTVAIVRADQNTKAAANNLTSVATESLVGSVRSDGDKGIIFQFTGSLPSTVHLTKSDFTQDKYYKKTLADGTVVLAWSHEFPQLDRDDPAKGLQDYRYVNVLGGAVWVSRQPGHHFRMVYGRKTPDGSLPACSGAENCTARYSGVLDGEIWPANVKTDATVKIRGDLEISADFRGARLQGEATNITGTEPGEYSPYSSWPTSRFDIRDGRIVDEQFTATLTGLDDGTTVDLAKSVSGFGGNLTGEFYGPTGAELGGVFTATRYLDGTTNDRILTGHILGKKTAGADLPISIATSRAGDASTAMSQSMINSIRSDGDKGVILEIGGSNPQTIHLTKSDLVTSDGSPYYGIDSDDGPDVYLWANETPSFADDLIKGLRDYRHLNVLGASIWIPGQAGESSRLILGQQTPPGQLPACYGASDCEARYTGNFAAFSWKATDSSSDQRELISGNQFELTADLGRATLQGEISEIRGRSPGSDTYVSWPTSQISISDGQIADGRFTATVTGSDSATSPDLAASLSDYSGTMKGQFYGPTGEELGGLVSATRDVAGTDNDRVLEGHVIGKRTLLNYARFDVSPISDGVYRYDYSSDPRIELYGADDNVNAVFADGKGNHVVRYTIDGVTRHAQFAPEDLGSVLDNIYTKRTGDREVWFSKRHSGAHMDVAGFHAGTYADETSDTVTEGSFGYVAYGDRTDAGEMPAGSATYSGSMEAREWEPSPESASSSAADVLRGTLALTANFDRSSITGRMHSLKRRTSGSDSDTSVSGQLTLSSGRMDGSALTANLGGLGYTGSMKGAFYGPDALEVGGTLRGTKSTGDMLQGWFAGDKD